VLLAVADEPHLVAAIRPCFFSRTNAGRAPFDDYRAHVGYWDGMIARRLSSQAVGRRSAMSATAANVGHPMTMRRTIRVFMRVVAQLGITLLILPPRAFSQSVVKLWSVDLSQDQDFRMRSNAPEEVLRRPMLDFLNEDQIIVAFDDNAMSTLTARTTIPFGFHVLEVGVGSGNLGRKLLFKVIVDTSQAEATGEGNFLVLTGEEVKKFSPSFKEVASFPTPLELHGHPTEQRLGGTIFLNPHYELWSMHVAIDGKSFALAHRQNPREMEVTWLRTSDFAVLDTAEGTPVNRERITTKGQEVWLFPYNWAKRLLSSFELLPICNGCLEAHFLTDDLVFLDEQDKYEIKTISGKTRARGKLQIGAIRFSRASNATRFAYATGHAKGWGFPLQTHFAPHMEVKVFDWSTMKQMGKISFDMPEQPENSVSSGFKESAIALSPNGHQLAVLTGSVLNLYKLR
jgi:hypothetical protein